MRVPSHHPCYRVFRWRGRIGQAICALIYWDRKKADGVDFAKYRENVAEGYFWDAYVGATDFYVHPGVLSGLSEQDKAKLKK